MGRAASAVLWTRSGMIHVKAQVLVGGHGWPLVDDLESNAISFPVRVEDGMGHMAPWGHLDCWNWKTAQLTPARPCRDPANWRDKELHGHVENQAGSEKDSTPRPLRGSSGHNQFSLWRIKGSKERRQRKQRL